MTERELFKEAVMLYLVDDAEVQHAGKRRKAHPVARRVLFAAACLLVAASVMVFSIPSARAAVEEWLSGWFSAGGYFGQEKEDAPAIQCRDGQQVGIPQGDRNHGDEV